MTKYILSEISFVIYSLACGILMGIIYSLIELFRKKIRHYQLLMAIEDIVYWIFSAALMYATIVLANNGKVRIYAIIFMFIGLFGSGYLLKLIGGKFKMLYKRVVTKRHKEKHEEGSKARQGE